MPLKFQVPAERSIDIANHFLASSKNVAIASASVALIEFAVGMKSLLPH
jgi:hypothetical protein